MSLWVGNISKNVRNSELEDEFNKFGRCTIKPKVSVGRAFSHNFDLGQLCIHWVWRSEEWRGRYSRAAQAEHGRPWNRRHVEQAERQLRSSNGH